jgi:23S rRNA (uridine2552-2'-O)-methyltransferase
MITGTDTRVRMMAKHSKSWLQRQKRDPFVKKSHEEQYRSRAVYKLMEIDQRDRLFHRGQTVIDLGAAPGGWSQYAATKVDGGGRVIAVDMLEMEAVAGVEFVRGDFTEEAVIEACLAALGGARADLVISDMAPNLSGVRSTDQARCMGLAEAALDFACRVLSPGGDFLVKLFQGAGTEQYRRELNERFQKVMVRKPKASRDSSREFYMLARRYNV